MDPVKVGPHETSNSQPLSTLTINGLKRHEPTARTNLEIDKDRLTKPAYNDSVKALNTGPIKNTQSEMLVNTSNSKSWKRRNREGSENNVITSSEIKCSVGKRLFKECADGDEMDVDFAKKSRDDLNTTTGVAVQHHRSQ